MPVPSSQGLPCGWLPSPLKPALCLQNSILTPPPFVFFPFFSGGLVGEPRLSAPQAVFVPLFSSGFLLPRSLPLPSRFPDVRLTP